MCHMPYANNKGADQPAHPGSLISTFVVHCLDSMICVVALSSSGWPLVREKSGKFDFLQDQGKVREFCKLVREILNTKEVREKSGNS